MNDNNMYISHVVHGQRRKPHGLIIDNTFKSLVTSVLYLEANYSFIRRKNSNFVLIGCQYPMKTEFEN